MITEPVQIQRSAALLVEIFPIGKGRVTYLVTDRGPEPLGRDEAVRALRGAADRLEMEGDIKNAENFLRSMEPSSPEGESDS